MLRLPDDWVCDSWIADDGERYHLYFLKRTLVDPNLRHARATIVHASSLDLTNWTYHGDALRPDPAGWDDLALWTGSVVQDDDGVYRGAASVVISRPGQDPEVMAGSDPSVGIEVFLDADILEVTACGAYGAWRIA